MDEVREQVWQGKIYICVEVTEPESIGQQEFLLAVNRVSYLELHLPKIVAYFHKFLDYSRQGNWWFSYNDTPLSPVRQIGLLYDMFVYEDSSGISPWRLRLRCDDYPAKQIMQVHSEDELKSYWNDQLKESCYIIHGNSRRVMSLCQKDHEVLWQCVKEPSTHISTFWDIRDTFLKASKVMPVKVYYEIDGQWKMEQFAAKKLPSGRFVLHGIKVSKSKDLLTLYESCCYPDGFLHVVSLPAK